VQALVHEVSAERSGVVARSGVNVAVDPAFWIAARDEVNNRVHRAQETNGVVRRRSQ
jgi:hypothetical protein